MKTMIKTLLVATALAGACSTVQANAATFNFTYTTTDGNILGGRFNGTLGADGNTFTTVAAATDFVSLNGTKLNIIAAYNETYNAAILGTIINAGGGNLTIDGSFADLLYTDSSADLGIGFIVNAGFPDLNNGKSIYIAFTSYTALEPFIASNFRASVVNDAAVPETATWAMMIAGFGMMGAAMRARRRSTKVSFG